jgi:hypothetical protein
MEVLKPNIASWPEHMRGINEQDIIFFEAAKNPHRQILNSGANYSGQADLFKPSHLVRLNAGMFGVVTVRFNCVMCHQCRIASPNFDDSFGLKVSD